MKWKTLLFLLVLIAVTSFFLTKASAAESPVFVEQYTLGVDAPAGLWKLRAMHGKSYRHANTWQEFKRFTCAHSGISAENCNDAYLSNLKRGTVVAIPATQVFVQVPEGVKAPETMSLVQKGSDPKLLMPLPLSMASAPAAVDSTLPLRAELARVQSLKQRADLLAQFFFGCSLVLMITLFLYQKRLSRKEHELTVKNERIFALMERVKTIAFTMPPFAIHEMKGTEVILPVASVDGNGEPFVAPEWTPHPMKLSQLEAFMYRAFLKNEALPHIQWKLETPKAYEEFDVSPIAPFLREGKPVSPLTLQDAVKLTPEDCPKEQVTSITINAVSKHE